MYTFLRQPLELVTNLHLNIDPKMILLVILFTNYLQCLHSCCIEYTVQLTLTFACDCIFNIYEGRNQDVVFPKVMKQILGPRSMPPAHV